MIAFELRGVTGGWDTAALGPSDQVEFVVSDVADGDDADGGNDVDDFNDAESVLHTFGSVHQLLRLYDCASRERTTHPKFLGYDLSERGDTVVLGLRTGRVETTYPALRDALEPFLADLFAALDAHPTHGTRAEHLDTLCEHDIALVDVTDLYDDLTGPDRVE